MICVTILRCLGFFQSSTTIIVSFMGVSIRVDGYLLTGLTFRNKEPRAVVHPQVLTSAMTAALIGPGRNRHRSMTNAKSGSDGSE